MTVPPTIRANALATHLDFLERAVALADHASVPDATRAELYADMIGVLNAIAQEPGRGRLALALKGRALLMAYRLETPAQTPFVALAVSLARSVVPA